MYKEIPARVSPLDYLDEFERINEERRQNGDNSEKPTPENFKDIPKEILKHLSSYYMEDDEEFPEFFHIYDEDEKLCEIYDELMEKMENYSADEMKDFLENSIDYINGNIANTSPLNGYESEEIEKITEIFNFLLYSNDEDMLKEIIYIIVKYKFTDKIKKIFINEIFEHVINHDPIYLKKYRLTKIYNFNAVLDLKAEIITTAENINDFLRQKDFKELIILPQNLNNYILFKLIPLIDIALEFIYAEEKEPLKNLILFISQNSRESAVGYLVENLPQNMAADIVERDDVEAFDVYENLPADVVEYSPAAVSVWGGS